MIYFCRPRTTLHPIALIARGKKNEPGRIGFLAPIEPGDRIRMSAWCLETGCGRRVTDTTWGNKRQFAVCFNTEEDLVMFVLRWGTIG